MPERIVPRLRSRQSFGRRVTCGIVNVYPRKRGVGYVERDSPAKSTNPGVENKTTGIEIAPASSRRLFSSILKQLVVSVVGLFTEVRMVTIFWAQQSYFRR